MKTDNSIFTEEWDRYLALATDAELFQRIHRSKKCFLNLFTELANQINNENLDEWHINFKGTKVSQGNALQNCPYQVLDIIRDFHPELGLNIRLLNWWGRGGYIFVFFGKITALKLMGHSPNRLRAYFVEQGFNVALTESPWDYRAMVDLENFERAQNSLDWGKVIERAGHLQVFKKLHFENTPFKHQAVLLEQIMTLGEVLKIPR